MNEVCIYLFVLSYLLSIVKVGSKHALDSHLSKSPQVFNKLVFDHCEENGCSPDSIYSDDTALIILAYILRHRAIENLSSIITIVGDSISCECCDNLGGYSTTFAINLNEL